MVKKFLWAVIGIALAAGCGTREVREAKDRTEELIVGVWDSADTNTSLCRERLTMEADKTFGWFDATGEYSGSYTVFEREITYLFTTKSAQKVFVTVDDKFLDMDKSVSKTRFLRVPKDYALKNPCPGKIVPPDSGECGKCGKCCRCGCGTCSTTCKTTCTTTCKTTCGKKKSAVPPLVFTEPSSLMADLWCWPPAPQNPPCVNCPPGKDGLPGKDGKPGEPGKDGKPGEPGKDGKDGKPGQPGEPGQPGKDGKDGEPGKDGKPGEPGRDGKDGKDGKDGSTVVIVCPGDPKCPTPTPTPDCPKCPEPTPDPCDCCCCCDCTTECTTTVTTTTTSECKCSCN